MMEPAQAHAAGVAAAQLGRHTADLTAVVDEAHAAGLHVPPAAAEAVRTLAALGLAWACNAQGRPSPAHARAQLGLPRIG